VLLPAPFSPPDRDFAGQQFEIDVIECGRAAEAFGDAAECQNCLRDATFGTESDDERGVGRSAGSVLLSCHGFSPRLPHAPFVGS
jgi:hypothetical protein